MGRLAGNGAASAILLADVWNVRAPPRSSIFEAPIIMSVGVCRRDAGNWGRNKGEMACRMKWEVGNLERELSVVGRKIVGCNDDRASLIGYVPDIVSTTALSRSRHGP